MKHFTVKDYVKILEENNQIKEIIDVDSNILEKEVCNLTYNSQDVKDNTMFVCKGFLDNFKEEYLIDAVNKGAFIYVSKNKYDVSIPCIVVKDAFVSLSILSKMYFNYNNKDINVIGITGTKGKSTTAYYIKYILDEYLKAVNKKDTAIISSIETYDSVERFKSHITTPESLDIFKHIANSVNSGIENIILEVSSQALKVGRVYSLDFDIGVFLNISEDHISQVEHPDFKDYFASKLKIYKKSKVACVNLDSDYSEVILKRAKSDSKEVITFSTKNENADIYAYNIRKKGLDTVFNVKCKDNFDKEFILTMPGIFNVENALAAIGVAYKLNIPLNYIYEGLKQAKSSGRMEIFNTKDQRIISIVDYAHNKLSFEKLYESTKDEYPDRKIITVFGCPGNKAYIRRRDLGIEAGKNSDKIYLTADDPGYESVLNICKEISKYIDEYNIPYEIIEDRSIAIKEAINFADKNFDKTVVLVAGKGNETSQKVRKRFCTIFIGYRICKKVYNRI